MHPFLQDGGQKWVVPTNFNLTFYTKLTNVPLSPLTNLTNDKKKKMFNGFSIFAA